MTALRTFATVVLIIAIMLIYSCFFTVSEGQQALLLRLGEIATDQKGQANILGPGIHYKWPFINKVRRFDGRLQTLPVESSRILTLDQKYVMVDYYIKWRIANLPLYYQRTGGDAVQAETLLQQQVNDVLRGAFGQRTLTDMVSGERINVMALLTQSANNTAKNLGIEVVDVRIKSIDLPKEVSERVFNRMRTKREQVATQLRADGKAQAEAIQATADAKASVTIAQTKSQSATIRAEGLAQAAKIYANAYNRDPSFYAFYRSLEAYKETFKNKSDVLILRPDSQFFKYFNSSQDKQSTITNRK